VARLELLPVVVDVVDAVVGGCGCGCGVGRYSIFIVDVVVVGAVINNVVVVGVRVRVADVAIVVRRSEPVYVPVVVLQERPVAVFLMGLLEDLRSHRVRRRWAGEDREIRLLEELLLVCRSGGGGRVLQRLLRSERQRLQLLLLRCLLELLL